MCEREREGEKERKGWNVEKTTTTKKKKKTTIAMLFDFLLFKKRYQSKKPLFLIFYLDACQELVIVSKVDEDLLFVDVVESVVSK